MFKRIIIALLIMFTGLSLAGNAQPNDEYKIARIKYRGGGDWYNDPSALENLISYARDHLPISINKEYDDIALGSPELQKYPFAFLTGHGNISINQAEAENLREYLDNGGFLYVDDDYGLDKYFRKEIKKVFPNEDLIEVPFDHPIYHEMYDFQHGPPKIHEHDGKPAQGFGIFRNGRMVLYYTYQSNVGDGWVDPEVHKDPQSIRIKAFKMGVNMLIYALTSGR